MLILHSLRHAYPEGAGFFIDRRRGHDAYTFLHFFEGIDLRVGETLLRTEPHACILYRCGTPQYFRTDTGLVHDWIHFSGDAEGLLAEAGVPLDVPFYPNGSSFITSLVWEMENEFYNRRTGYERLLDAKLTELFIKLGRASERKKPRRQPRRRRKRTRRRRQRRKPRQKPQEPKPRRKRRRQEPRRRDSEKRSNFSPRSATF